MTKLNRSVERGLKILEVISSNGVCSLAFLAERTGLPKPTILRICATLVQQRWLTQSRSDSRYRVGSRFPRVNPRPDSIDALVEAGAAAILALSEATGLGVDLAAPLGNGRIEIVDTTRTFSDHGIFPDCIGYRPSPFRSALGCAFLAALEPAQEAEYSARLAVHTTGKDRTAALALPAKLREVRAQGYATREDAYWGRAVDYGGVPSAIAVAIAAEGHIVGAVSLIWLAEQHSVPTIVKAHLEDLKATAREIGALYAANVG
ncbi:IclR family transcriptional regulator [Sulfitobacter sp. PS-8MA]|uniref:IclR family transcriptional regulator n=1 Tax=Sulfitobacter sp. PS-8MA TaxID=3237707 RepID=UPI0034C643AA